MSNWRAGESIYVVAKSRELALDQVWDDTEGDDLDVVTRRSATNLDDLAEKLKYRALHSGEAVYEVRCDPNFGLTSRIEEKIDAHQAAERRKKAQKEAEESVYRRQNRPGGTTSLHGLLSGGQKPVTIFHQPDQNTVALPQKLKIGNFQLAVETLKHNPDGSITVSGKIDAKQLGNTRR